MAPTRGLRRTLFHEPGRDLIERRRRHAYPLVIPTGAAGAVRVQLAVGSERSTIGVDRVCAMLGHADEINERSGSGPAPEVPITHANVVGQSTPWRIPRSEEHAGCLGIRQRLEEGLHRRGIDGPPVIKRLFLTAANEGDAERFRP